ncbi:MFS transporter [Paramicrobacterium humi]|uniref:MFS transporter n=1 Tax=Paramicrobacterium humi TaxID=640635 RepID=UPI000B80D0FF|nr:MFS transporter [Microbacterium humi]
MSDEPISPRRAGLGIAALSLGTLLNPLNSSMIAIALVTLREFFGLDVLTVTWVITAFYLASAAGQPLMGRLGDRFGPRRLFVFGMCVVVVACALTPFSPNFAFVCAGRVLLAIGTASAFPSAVSLLHPITSRSGLSSPRLLGRIQVANTAGAAIGPVIGGVLVTTLGWQAIFWINVPLAIIALVGVRLLAPADAPRDKAPLSTTLAQSDIPGILAFTGMLVSLLVFLLRMPTQPLWWLLAAAVVCGALFVWRELRGRHPFIDLRMLAGNRSLVIVYASFALFNLVYYCAFFGLPQFLEEHGEYRADATGLLMLPLAALNVLLTPFAARFIERRGVRVTLIGGGLWLVGSAMLLGLLAWSTAAFVPLLVTAAMGVPYCVVSIALSQALYSSARREQAGVASGIFQTSRYVGAILATTLLGIAFSDGTSPASWLEVTVVAAVLSAVLVPVLALWRPVSRRG